MPFWQLYGWCSATFLGLALFGLNRIRINYLIFHQLPWDKIGLQLAVFLANAALFSLELYNPSLVRANVPFIVKGVGLFLGLVGLGMFLLGVIHFGDIPGILGRHTLHLRTTGAYRFSRHPQYAGYGLLLLGWAICTESVYALLTWLQYVWFVSHLISIEERNLEYLHEQEFKKYASEVPRYLFFVGNTKGTNTIPET